MADRIQTLLTAERRLLQDIAHELRSPLARLSFATAWLESGEDRPGAAAQIRKDIDRLSSLVGSLMEMTRAEGDPSARRRDPVNVGALIEEVAGDCQVEAGAKGSAIRTIHGEADWVKGDAELLRGAVENILRNGIRYTAPGTIIEMQTRQAGGAIEIAVRDYGPGVPEPHIESIFAPSFRVDALRDSATGGVGLGLAIARRAIALHHGEVTAANANPGLRVTLRLPLGA